MNIEEYKARRASLVEPIYRETCPKCWKAIPTCFCAKLRPFTSPVSFVIIQHLDEARNPIATARMAHLSITNSKLIMDNDFSDNKDVCNLILNTQYRNIILYPSPDAMPIEQLFSESAPSIDSCVPTTTEQDTRPLVFWVLDTTWSHVPKMLRLSPSLRSIPMVKFTPEGASRFQIRKQPNPHCLSTIESIYLVIERFLKHHNLKMTEHQALIEVFQFMVEQQIEYGRIKNNTRHQATRAARAARARKKKNAMKVHANVV